MSPELAGAIAIAVMRIGFALLPASLNSFAFNEKLAIEVKEAINAIGARALIATWLPTTVAMSVAVAAAKGENSIKFIPFVLAIVLCVAIPFAIWKLLRLDWLRGTITAFIVVAVLTIADVLFLTYAQQHVVGLFLVTTKASPTSNATQSSAPTQPPSNASDAAPE